MITNSISGAAKSNPGLEPLSILIGEWKTVGKHPLLPNQVLRGHATFKWIEGGAFMMMQAVVLHPAFPAGIAIFGSDDSSDEYSMIYFDEREVSRKYISTLKNNVWKYWREDSEFSQQFTCKISNDGNTMVSKGKMSQKGKAWQKDLELTYTRIQDNNR